MDPIIYTWLSFEKKQGIPDINTACYSAPTFKYQHNLE